MGKLAVVSVTLVDARTSTLLQGGLLPSTIRSRPLQRGACRPLLLLSLSLHYSHAASRILVTGYFASQVNRIFPIAITSLSYECNLVSLLPIRRRRRPHSAAFPVTHIPSAFSAVAGALTSEYQANVTLFRPSVISQKCKLSSVCIRVSRSET